MKGFCLGFALGLLTSALLWAHALTILEIRVTIENPVILRPHEEPHELEA